MKLDSEPSTLTYMTARWELVLPHRERLLRIARRRLSDPSDAEDCVHDALLRCVLFDHLDEQRASNFLTSTLIRLCVDQGRREARAHRLRSLAASPDVEPDLEQILCDRAAGRFVADVALAELQGRERQVMAARARGLSTAQAAAAFGISVKAAEGAFTRARARLRVTCADLN